MCQNKIKFEGKHRGCRSPRWSFNVGKRKNLVQILFGSKALDILLGTVAGTIQVAKGTRVWSSLFSLTYSNNAYIMIYVLPQEFKMLLYQPITFLDQKYYKKNYCKYKKIKTLETTNLMHTPTSFVWICKSEHESSPHKYISVFKFSVYAKKAVQSICQFVGISTNKKSKKTKQILHKIL